MLLEYTKSFDYKGYNSKSKFVTGKIASFINKKGSQTERENWARRKNAIEWYKANPDRITEYGKKEVYDGDAHDKFHGKHSKSIKSKLTKRDNQFRKVDPKFVKNKYRNNTLKVATPLSVPIGLIPVPGSGPAFLALASGAGVAADKIKERKILRSSSKAKRANDLVNREKNKIRLQEKMLATQARYRRKLDKLNKRYQDL